MIMGGAEPATMTATRRWPPPPPRRPTRSSSSAAPPDAAGMRGGGGRVRRRRWCRARGGGGPEIKRTGLSRRAFISWRIQEAGGVVEPQVMSLEYRITCYYLYSRTGWPWAGRRVQVPQSEHGRESNCHVRTRPGIGCHLVAWRSEHSPCQNCDDADAIGVGLLRQCAAIEAHTPAAMDMYRKPPDPCRQRRSTPAAPGPGADIRTGGWRTGAGGRTDTATRRGDEPGGAGTVPMNPPRRQVRRCTTRRRDPRRRCTRRRRPARRCRHRSRRDPRRPQARRCTRGAGGRADVRASAAAEAHTAADVLGAECGAPARAAARAPVPAAGRPAVLRAAARRGAQLLLQPADDGDDGAQPPPAPGAQPPPAMMGAPGAMLHGAPTMVFVTDPAMMAAAQQQHQQAQQQAQQQQAPPPQQHSRRCRLALCRRRSPGVWRSSSPSSISSRSSSRRSSRRRSTRSTQYPYSTRRSRWRARGRRRRGRGAPGTSAPAGRSTACARRRRRR